MMPYRKLLLIKLLCAASFLTAALPAAWSQPQLTISGHVLTPNGEGVEGVSMEVSSPNASLFTQTDANGFYSVQVAPGGPYTVAPSYDQNPLNGVSTFDKVLIARHILNVELLNTPYKLIAADVDESGAIDGADTTMLFNLITGVIVELPDSWRFVWADYIFPDPANPFVPAFPESFTVDNLNANLSDLDFIGMKMGDVNYTAIANNGSVSNFTTFTGLVRIDQNANCTADTDEPTLTGWVVEARNGLGSYVGLTTSFGNYQIHAPAGTYDLILHRPNGLWEGCVDTVAGLVGDTFAVNTIHFAVTPAVDCPAMTVDLSAPFLRRCFDNTYQITYCNQGTIIAEDAQVTVQFDTFLTVLAVSHPWSSVDGQTYTFDVGDVSPGQCNSIGVTVNLSCDAVLGQTHCSSAHITPDSICVPFDPLWSGAQLELTGACAGDEVVFTLTNHGAPMTEPVGYVVIEDIMIQMSAPTLPLGTGQSQTVTVPANGSTWRMQVDQAPFHPFSTAVSAAVEGCGLNGNGAFSLGLVTVFPLGDQGPFDDEDCQENIGSFDPNDKQAFPRGVAAEHYLPQGEEIEYLIRFQNTGTDTAFNVVIRDTLSALLDLATVRPLGSSHPYVYTLTGPGIAVFSFPNVLLPDSTADEPASHGYVKFAVTPRAGLPDGLVIDNEAAIYFDFNTPVFTNTVFHTLGDPPLSMTTVPFRPEVTLDVYPNPAGPKATFLLKTPYMTEGLLRLFDSRGRTVRTQAFASNRFSVSTAGLPPGFYFFRLEDRNGQWLAAGKLAIRG